jgi:predicted nucleic acid-binding protein
VRRLVLDAPLFLAWFEPDGAGQSLRREYEAGSLTVVAPRTFRADVLALLARRDGWPADRLPSVATELDRLRFDLREPATASLATWIARGLGADRAAYPALATDLDLRLATDDPELRRIASSLVIGS